MDAERRRRIDELYRTSLEREPGERVVFLAAACHGDEELRHEIESLLAQQSRSLVEKPVPQQALGLTGGQGLAPGAQLAHIVF